MSIQELFLLKVWLKDKLDRLRENARDVNKKFKDNMRSTYLDE